MTAGTPATAERGQKAGVRHVLTRGLMVAVAGILVTLAALIVFPPVGPLKDRLAKIAGDKLGRMVTLKGAHLSFRPDLALRLDGVTISNPQGMAGEDFFRADEVAAEIRLLALFKGKTEILSLHLTGPDFRLQQTASGAPNWQLATRSSTASKGPIALPQTVRIDKGRIAYTSAASGETREIKDLSAAIDIDPVSGASTSKGHITAADQAVAFDISVGDIRAAAGGLPSSATASFESVHGKARFEGQALVADRTEFTGTLEASSPSAVDFLRWMGTDVTASGEPLKTAISGKVKATDSDVTFAGTDIEINGSRSRLDGRLALDGPRPKLEGNLASDRLDLARIVGSRRPERAQPQALGAAPGEEIEVSTGWQSLLDELNRLEKGPTALRAAPEETTLSAQPVRGGWSEQPFNLKALRSLDLDLVMTADEVAYGNLDLKKARMKTGLNDGLLETKLESLDVGKGKATGNLSLDSRATPPRAALDLNLTDVAAEPIVAEITGKPLLAGTSNVEISAKAAGQNQSQLTSTLEGKAKFRMGKGAVRGFDVRRMISEWWRKWTFDLGMKTGFERLEAQYDIRKGVMKSSPDLVLGGSEVEINSRGDVNVAAKRINQEIRIKVVPPPTALPVPVKISGNWAKPDIGIDWGGLFSGVAGFGGPQGVAASRQPAPPEVQAAIRRVLAADIDPSQLSPEGKAMLRSLLPSQ